MKLEKVDLGLIFIVISTVWDKLPIQPCRNSVFLQWHRKVSVKGHLIGKAFSKVLDTNEIFNLSPSLR